MIAPVLVAKIKCLLEKGVFSQRKISTTLGVSRGTVSNIASGNRPDYEALRRQREQEDNLMPTGPVVRCSGCGGMVHIPCQLCRIRQISTDRRRRKLHVQQQIQRLTSHRPPVTADR
jgi:hypothetical protein